MQRIATYDFIKGGAILSVILHHAICMWMPSLSLLIPFVLGHAVPLFLLTTIVLTYQKYEHNPDATINHARLFRKILLPFLFAQVAILPMTWLTTGITFTDLLKCFGVGMGTYYILVYLQILFLAKSVFSLLKWNFWAATVILLAAHIGCDLLFRSVGLPEWAYRLLCTRYLFLFVVGYLFAANRLSNKLLTFVILGGVMQALTVFGLFDFDIYPSEGFVTNKFYRDFISLAFFVLLWKCYPKVPKFIDKSICFCGRHSYALFIAQMIFFPYVVYMVRVYRPVIINALL